MLRESQRFDAQQTNIRAAQQRQGELDQANLQFKIADEQRAAEARKLWSASAHSIIGADPYRDTESKIGSLQAEMPELEKTIRGYGKDPIYAKERLRDNTLLESMKSELQHKQRQLSDPLWMQNQYTSKASQLTELAGQMGQYDLRSAGLLTQHAGVALQQADQFAAQARMRDSRTGQAQPVQAEAVLVKNGKIVDTQKAVYNKVAGQSVVPADVNPDLKGYVWKSQYDANIEPRARQPKEYVFRARELMRVDILGKENIIAPTSEQNAFTKYTLKLYDNATKALDPKSESAAMVLTHKAQAHHRKIHNKYYAELKKRKAKLKAMRKRQGRKFEETYQAELQQLNDDAIQEFGYLPIDRYDEQLGQIMTRD
jgi:hypothetical protein